MPDYAYYCDHYLGEDIPETEFAVCMRRAEGKLAYMKEVYAVQPRKGLTAEEAENMALCAIADAVYEFKQEDEARRHAQRPRRPLPPRGGVLPADRTVAEWLTTRCLPTP